MPAHLPPYVTWRDGRPRFIASRRERDLGFQGEDLKDGAGRWLSYEAACARGWEIYAQVLDCRGFDPGQVQAMLTAARASQALPLKPAKPPHKLGETTPAGVPRPKARTVEALLDDWLHALEHEEDPAERLSPDTIESYRKSRDAIVYKPEARPDAAARRKREGAAELLGLPAPARAREPFARAPVAAIGKIELNEFYKYAVRARGHYMARGMVAAFSAAWTWGGLSKHWRLGANPRHELELAVPEGRIVVFTDAEINALIAAGDAIGRGSVGDAIVLGLFTSQRQRDRLRLVDEGLTDNRRMFRQSKTRKLVAVRDTPMLAARLGGARARVAAIALARGLKPEQRPATVVVDESTGASYVQDTYRHVFGEVRLVAVHGLVHGETPADVRRRVEAGELPPLGDNRPWVVAPCPSIEGKRDQDLRDTAVTWLARAGCTMAEICAITGHSGKSVQTIIEHYLGAARELADAAIDKLEAWMLREGIAV